MGKSMSQYLKPGLVILLSVALILFTQQVKLLKNPASTPVSWMTIYGLFVLWLYCMIGILISNLMKKAPMAFLRQFPVLGWVSVTSLVLCLVFDSFVKAIHAVDFLAITTPILTYAGVSVAERLVDLSKTSWRVAIVAVFVFAGTFVGSAALSQFGLMVVGK